MANGKGDIGAYQRLNEMLLSKFFSRNIRCHFGAKMI